MTVLLSSFLIPGLLALSLGLFHLVGPVPTDLGLEQGALAACPSPAHCARESWPVADPEAALQLVLPVLLEQPRVELIEQRGGYVHATASSALFGFVDDVELYADPTGGVLQARSVSRLGDSDLGVNAKRLGLLRASLTPEPGA